MKLSADAIEYLVDVILGSGDGYRSGPQLVQFFNRYGEYDLYRAGFPSRHIYVREKLNALNGHAELSNIIVDAFTRPSLTDDEQKTAAIEFSRLTAHEGVVLQPRYGRSFEVEGVEHKGQLGFKLEQLPTVSRPPAEILLQEDSLSEHVKKAKRRIEDNDFSGSIAICYTLIEAFLKKSLEDAGRDFNPNEGDIKKLYKLYAQCAGLEVSADTNEALKPVLSGLSTIVHGFYEIANKGSDRHASVFSPSRHHAELVVSLTFSFCEFLLGSRKHRTSAR